MVHLRRAGDEKNLRASIVTAIVNETGREIVNAIRKERKSGGTKTAIVSGTENATETVEKKTANHTIESAKETARGPKIMTETAGARGTIVMMSMTATEGATMGGTKISIKTRIEKGIDPPSMPIIEIRKKMIGGRKRTPFETTGSRAVGIGLKTRPSQTAKRGRGVHQCTEMNRGKNATCMMIVSRTSGLRRFVYQFLNIRLFLFIHIFSDRGMNARRCLRNQQRWLISPLRLLEQKLQRKGRFDVLRYLEPHLCVFVVFLNAFPDINI